METSLPIPICQGLCEFTRGYLFDISQRLTVVTSLRFFWNRSIPGTGRLREGWRGTEVQRVGGGDETAARDARCSLAKMAIEP